MYDRSKTIGASDATYIAEGRWAELFDTKSNPLSDALSGVLPVQVGKATEQVNLDWFEREAGISVARYGNEDEPFKHSSHPWMCCLPDGLATVQIKDFGLLDTIPIEAKHVNQFWNPRNLIAKYTPQVLHQMMIFSAPFAYLSVIYGNGLKYDFYKIDYDPIAADELLRQEELFMWFLDHNIRPPE